MSSVQPASLSCRRSYQARLSWLLLVVGLWLVPLQAKEPELPPAEVEPVDLGRWFSRMWRPVASYGGLLSEDELEDVVVVLHRRDAIHDDDQLPVGSRGLAIFTLSPKGVYRREALAEGILPCVQCMGPISRDANAAPFEVSIEDRRLTLSWISNAEGFVYVRLVIAWDAQQGAFGLIEDEVVRADQRGGIKSRRLRDYRAGKAVSDGQVTEFLPRFIPAEQVKATDYR